MTQVILATVPWLEGRESFPLRCFRAMGMNPLGGGVSFVDEQEFFVKASQVIVKVTFSIWRSLLQKVVM